MAPEQEMPSIARLVAWSALSLVALSTLSSALGWFVAGGEGGLALDLAAILLLVLTLALAVAALGYLWRELRRLDRLLFRW